jgi:hypothetical protein
MRCEECGREAEEDARGWKAFLTRYATAEEAEHPELTTYCPDCAEREFGHAEEELFDR